MSRGDVDRDWRLEDDTSDWDTACERWADSCGEYPESVVIVRYDVESGQYRTECGIFHRTTLRTVAVLETGSADDCDALATVRHLASQGILEQSDRDLGDALADYLVRRHGCVEAVMVDVLREVQGVTA
jgi:hypothetical protein